MQWFTGLRLFSAATVNDVMFGYARPYWLYAKDTSVPDAAAAIGLLNTSGLGGGPGFSNGYSMNSSLSFYLEGTDNIYHFADDLTHVRGRHSFKFGFQAIERRFYYNNQSNDKGYFYLYAGSDRDVPRWRFRMCRPEHGR